MERLRSDHESKKPFSVKIMNVTEAERNVWVKIRKDPEAFRKSLFDGDWADAAHHPDLGQLRILRVITGHDGVSRIIARQGDFLFAYPLHGN